MIIVNAMLLIVCSQYLSGFYVANNLKLIFGVALLLTIINILIRPILKLILSPIIILTLGLGVLIVNGLVLYLLDISSPNIKIEGLTAWVYSILLFTVVNYMFHIATKKSK